MVHLRPTKLPLPLTLSPAPRLRSAACSPCALLLRRALLRRHIPYITFENTSIKQPVFALPLLSSFVRQVYVSRLAVRLSKPVPITDPASCKDAVEGYCIPRKSAVPPTPPNATQARAQALLSFVVYLSGQLTSFRCSSCAPCYIVSLSCLFLRQMPGGIVDGNPHSGPLPPGLCRDR